MDLYPAIDLRAGRAVRLLRGDYDQETVYGDDPVAMAAGFADAGASWIHVVDLDAARSGDPVNRPVVEAVVAPSRGGPACRPVAACAARPTPGCWPRPEWPGW